MIPKGQLQHFLQQESQRKIINSEEFYFQKGQDALKEWLEMELSESLRSQMLNHAREYDYLQQQATKISELKYALNCLFHIISYCDTNAKGKRIHNRYSDHRTLAKASVRMPSWIEGLILLKLDSDQLRAGSVKNALDYLLNPSENITVLSEEHRRQISQNLLHEEYDPSVFVQRLKGFFESYGISVSHGSNYTHLLMKVVYGFQAIWKEEVIGLMASDKTGWQEHFILEMQRHNAGIVWNTKKPTKSGETLKFLRQTVEDGGTFNLYYSHGKSIRYKATVLDFAVSQEELDQKQWVQEYSSIAEYMPNFHEYVDDNKKARIVFLVQDMVRVTPEIPISEFQFYKDTQPPRQDNLQPLSKEPEIDESMIEKTTTATLSKNKATHPSNPTYWLFQDNPKYYDTAAALNKGLLKQWTVQQHKHAISVGDRVIIWTTGENAGCYALAEVVSPVGNMPIPEEELPFYKDEKLLGVKDQVGIKVTHNLANNPISYKEELQGHPSFERTKGGFNGGNQGTNLRATPEQYFHLKALAEKRSGMNTTSPNQILYGPPGTGKTYHTINKALSIIEGRPEQELDKEERHELKNRYDQYLKDGQIQFVTFHQSMSYEDFVEGIKPIPAGKPGNEDGEEMTYKVKAGIFKQSCQRAFLTLVNQEEKDLQNDTVAFDDAYNKYIKHIEASSNYYFKSLKDKNLQFAKKSSANNLALLYGESQSSDKKPNLQWVSKNRLKRLVLSNYTPNSIQEAKGSTLKKIREITETLATPSAYWAVWNDFYNQMFEYMADEEEGIAIKEKKEQETNMEELIDAFNSLEKGNLAIPSNSHILIIDEINRGNIAAIFGELITLLEEDKRAGQKEALEVTLPYSKEPFSVPPNLYLIGTMNTADRSVEALDTALRRRFEFVEMPPQPNRLSDIKVEGLELDKLLTAINERIEVLIDKDHCIGHSAFIKLKNTENKLEGLKKVFQHKLIPQLQEYFYGDFGKIAMIIGTDFFDSFKPQNNVKFMEVEGMEASMFDERPIYRFQNVLNMGDEEFIEAVKKIYH